MDLTGLMKPLKDYVFVRANPTQNAVKTLAPGVEILIDQTWDPHAIHHVTQDGRVEYIARGMNKQYRDDINFQKMELKVGDHVYAHHWLCNKDKMVQDTDLDKDGYGLYYIMYGQIYCIVKDGKIKMIGEWNLIDPLETVAPKSNIPNFVTKVNSQKEPLKGVARHINAKLRKLGIKVGDVVYFDADSDYEIIIEGETCYRMENTYILGIAN